MHRDELVDLGTRSLLCSRRADVFKVWVALQRYGSSGIGALYDHLCETTRALYGASWIRWVRDAVR